LGTRESSFERPAARYERRENRLGQKTGNVRESFMVVTAKVLGSVTVRGSTLYAFVHPRPIL